MKPLLGSSASLRTLLLVTALLKNSQAECFDENKCPSNVTDILTTTTTTVTLASVPNCTLTAGSVSGEGSVTGLSPGVVYQIYINCSSCCTNITTKPEKVRELSATGTTTSSIRLTWKGSSSRYKVLWAGGNSTVAETSLNITHLRAGVRYIITVTGLADDDRSEGDHETVSVYTRPGIIQMASVSTNTSSVSLSWNPPAGEVLNYKLTWTNGGAAETMYMSHTSAVLADLIPGTNYTITVVCVAGDNHTEGQAYTFNEVTRPGIIQMESVSTNTSSVSLSWNPPAGEVLNYKLTWANGGAAETMYTSQTSAVLADLIPGTNYTITVVCVAGDNHTEGQAYTFNAVTKPAAIRNLHISSVTTSSVSLIWDKPEGDVTLYILTWMTSDDTASTSSPTTDTTFTINSLTPGSQYNITAAAVAGELSNEGERTQISTFTQPAKPENVTVTARGTSTLNVSWTLPEGRADRYGVNISNVDLMFSKSHQTALTTARFTDLYPGRIYVVTVTAGAGTFRSTSEEFSFATVPEPPGSVSVSQRTNMSLLLQWESPSRMVGAPNISYAITHQLAATISSRNSTELSPLASGTLYNVTVETVGPQNLRSTGVALSVYTLPNPVRNLVASPHDTTSVTVEWSYPQEAHDHYKYLVQTLSDTGAFVKNVTDNKTDVTHLEPGTRYNITVTTIAAEGSESTVEETFTYTMPKAVGELSVNFVNTTAIQLTWLRQSDHKPSYSYKLVQDGKMDRIFWTKTEKYTFLDLTPGQEYSFQVFAVVEGVMSAARTKSCHTTPSSVSDITAVGSTTSMSVSWSPAMGRVDSYTVRLYRDSQLVGEKTDLSNTTVRTGFQDLKPGVLYCVVVLTRSGPLENTMATACNATFPNPPGPIAVVSQTVDSINVTWAPPDDMDPNQYNFSVFTGKGHFIIRHDWFLMDSLQSGTLYSISVVTVGLLDYESKAVTANSSTRPHPVAMLREAGITTNTLTLVWEQKEIKSDYSYVVDVANRSFFRSENASTTTHTVSGLQSGTNYSFAVTTQTADGTLAAPVTNSYFTRPYGITGLDADTLNSTTLHLTWIKPLEYKPEYTYRVETSGCDFQNKLVALEFALISGLPPGTNCTFCVSVRAEDGTGGEETCISQFTKPEAVQPSIASRGSNSSVLVSWADPPGNVDYYIVHLDNYSKPLQRQTGNSTSNSLLFESLSAGRLYTAMVTTHSGPFSASSDFVTNATFPNPPGSIEILTKTTTSIDLMWTDAPLMAGASFHYELSHTPSNGSGYITTPNTSHTFVSLLSGTSYNISVTTVAAMGFKSVEVHSYLVNTRPLSVKLLKVSTEEENITVAWTEPDDYKESYYYNLTWRSADGFGSGGIMTKGTDYTVDFLVPGSSYNFSVTTEMSDGTQSAPRWISDCTNASPVTNYTCEGPNQTNAEIIVRWSDPNGQYYGLEVTGKEKEVIHVNRTCDPRCSHSISNLIHYREYNVTAQTLSCGQPSTPVILLCRTGITAPPVPHNFTSLVKLNEKEHNRFSIQISSSLLDDTNGPVTDLGVLVTSSVSEVNTSDLSKYLGKTHKDWSENNSPAYLATVVPKNTRSRSDETYFIINIGDGSMWKGYTNGALQSNGRYQYAMVMFTSMRLENGLVSGEDLLVSITDFYSAVELPQDPAVISIAVGATLGIFCVFFIILAGFIIYWKRFSNKESPDIQIHSVRSKVSMAVRVEEYEAYYKKQKADSNCGFAEEFEDLKPVGVGQSKTHALSLENKPKNRYNNVIPYDSSRVKLSIIHGNPYDDYINANYMPGYNSRKEFIAAQGPLPGTVNEFWRMIWEKNVQTLVMLTRCNEQGRVKCDQYWQSGTRHFEYITVTTTSEIPLEDWTIRDFDVKNVKTAETRSVRQFHFTAWPDHRVPETTELLISFRHLVREHMDQYSRNSPTVVHCSAGVGRTGTFIAIDRLIFQIESENLVDVYGIVHDLRMHRPLMVQTEDQYVFLNQCAMDIIRSRTGTNVDLIYQNTAALSIYENVEPKKSLHKNG